MLEGEFHSSSDLETNTWGNSSRLEKYETAHSLPNMGLVIRLSLVLALIAVLSQNVQASNKENAAKALFPSYKKYDHKEEEEEDYHEGLKTFAEVETKMRNIVDEVIRKVLPYVIRASADIRLSGQCMASIFKLVIGLQKLQDWAIRMIDAAGKPPSGIIQGTGMALGDFDECLNIKVERSAYPNISEKEEYFHGKYCMVEFRLPKGIMDAAEEYDMAPNNMKMNTSLGRTKTFLKMLGKLSSFVKAAAFRFGVCIPSTCDEDDLGSIVNTATKQIGFPLEVLHCQEKEVFHIRAEQQVILSILGLLILPVLVGTAGEFYFSMFPDDFITTKSTARKLCTKLSIICNTKKLFDVNEKKEHPFPVARGLLFLTVALNIFAHTYALANQLFFLKYSNILNFFEFMKDFSFSFVGNGSNGIENYFFIAGFLLTYMRWKEPLATVKIGFIKLILKPYIRLTVLQLFGMGLLLLLPLIGYGPFFRDFVGPYLDNCRTRWWINMFYIQNYWDVEETCLYHTWVFAVIMQMYVLAIAAIWLLIRKPNVGIAFILTLIVLGMAMVGATVFLKKLPGALSIYVIDLDSAIRIVNSLFTQLFDHIGSFCIGLLTGFLLPKYASSFKFKPLLLCVCWCITLASLLAVIMGLFEYRSIEDKMNSNLSILYAMLNRNVYALFLAWVFVVCATGNAVLLSDILSWKAMIPGYRLSLLAYIIHLIVIYYHMGILRERTYLSHEENVINYFGYLVTSYLLAFVCYVFFQAPYMHLERFVYKKLHWGCGKYPITDSPAISDSSVAEQVNCTYANQRKTNLPPTLGFMEPALPSAQLSTKDTQLCKV